MMHFILLALIFTQYVAIEIVKRVLQILITNPIIYQQYHDLMYLLYSASVFLCFFLAGIYTSYEKKSNLYRLFDILVVFLLIMMAQSFYGFLNILLVGIGMIANLFSLKTNTYGLIVSIMLIYIFGQSFRFYGIDYSVSNTFKKLSN